MPPVRCRALFVFLVIALAMPLDPPSALARDTDKSWEFGAYAVLGHYANGAGMDDGLGFGARGGYHFKAAHELEGTLIRLSADDATSSGVSFDVTELNVDYVHPFLLKGHEKIVPIAAFGVGLIDIDNGTDNANSATYRVGGGFKYFFKPKVGIRFDVMMFHWHGGGGAGLPPPDPYFSYDATLGVTFLVGGAT